MPRAKLHITLPEDVWVADLTTRYPDSTLRVLAALGREDLGVGLIEIRGPNPTEMVEELAEYDAVEGVTRLGTNERREVIQFETAEPLLVLSGRASGVPLEPPIDIEDGTATVEVTAPRERLSTFGTQLEQFGMRFQVDYVHHSVEGERLLTERQRDLLSAAVERGYYDTPRDCSLTDLAEDLDMAKSTVSEILHRAEGAVVKEFLGERESDR